jgi:uncharacterized RDD family membrane protein YckC
VSAAPRTRTIRASDAERLQGGRAGFVSRVAADGVDFVVVELIYFGILLGIAVVRFLLTRKDFSVVAPDVWVTVLAQWFIIVLYLGTNWASTGRSIGKIMLGLQVLRSVDLPLSPRRAFTRAVFSATFWPSLLWIFVSRRNAALHDMVLHTKVVYSWRDDPAAAAIASATAAARPPVSS